MEGLTLRDAMSEQISDGSDTEVRRLEEPEDDSYRFMEVTGKDLSSSSEEEEEGMVKLKMMELFSVQFVDYDPVKLAEVYGILLLHFALNPYVLFERFRGDPLPVDSNGFVKLTGPRHVLEAYDRIECFAFLTDFKGHCHEFYDDMSYECKEMCNRPLSKRWATRFGLVEVHFASFYPSHHAILEVMLLDWKDKVKCDGKNTEPTTEIEVFGVVTARTKLISDKRAKSYMFKREKEKCALVKPGESLPLSRRIIIFPLKSSIVLDVLLCHLSDNDSDSGADHLIVSGRVEVPATARDAEFVLKGDSARVRLKITQGHAKLTNVISDDSCSRATEVHRPEAPENNSSRFMEVTGEDLSSEEEDMKVGYRLMEVFSVQFVDYDSMKLAEIYGILLLDCASTPYVLFERFPGDPLLIDSNGFVKLTGPSRVHAAYDRIEFLAFLSDLGGCVEKSYDNLWDGIHDERLGLFNKLLFKRLDTKFGTVEVSFAVFTVSTEAVLEVKLLEWKGKGKHNEKSTEPAAEIEVFGAVTARTKLISEDNAKSYMFKREKENSALVKPGEALPLSRRIVIFPVKSSIVLDVYLFHPFNDDPASRADDLVMNGRVEVPATRMGEGFILEGDSTHIQLKITQGDTEGSDSMEYLRHSISDESFSRATEVRRLEEPENNSRLQRQFAIEAVRTRRRLVEVLSVWFCDEFWATRGEKIYGFALLEPSISHRHAILFGRKSHDPSFFLHKLSIVNLNGPMHGVEVKDELAVNAYLWTLHAPMFNKKYADTLWRAGVDETDQVIRKEVKTDFGPLRIAFAVYSDGVEAHLEVALVDWNAPDGVQAFGTVDTRSSRFPGETSSLFNRSIDEAIPVKPGKDVTNLPLSKSVTVVPRESTLFVDLFIKRRGSSGRHPDRTFQTLSFDAKLGGTQTEVAPEPLGDHGNVQVTVTFSH